MSQGGGDVPSALDLVSEAVGRMEKLARVDPDMQPAAAEGQALLEQLSDLARTLEDYAESLEFNPARLQEVEERLELIATLKRKYHVELEFYAEIDPAESKTNHTAKNIEFKLQKKELGEEYWPRLLKEPKRLHFLKTDFDKWVHDKIGLNYETFTSSVLLLQGRAEKLLDSKPSGRAEVLASIVDLERYQKLHEKANARKLLLKSKLEALSHQAQAVPDISDMEYATALMKIDDAEQARDAAAA